MFKKISLIATCIFLSSQTAAQDIFPDDVDIQSACEIMQADFNDAIDTLNDLPSFLDKNIDKFSYTEFAKLYPLVLNVNLLEKLRDNSSGIASCEHFIKKTLWVSDKDCQYDSTRNEFSSVITLTCPNKSVKALATLLDGSKYEVKYTIDLMSEKHELLSVEINFLDNIRNKIKKAHEKK